MKEYAKKVQVQSRVLDNKSKKSPQAFRFDTIQKQVPTSGSPFKPLPNTGSYVAKGGKDIKYDPTAHPRERFSFGRNTRYEVFRKWNPTMVGNRIVSIRAASGAQVNVEGVQLDHQISWDKIGEEMNRKNTDGTIGSYSFWDAKMYYNDIDNLVPALGALNAAAGVKGVAVENRPGETLEAAIGVVQQSWMDFQHIVNALNDGQGISTFSEEDTIHLLLDISNNINSLSEKIKPK